MSASTRLERFAPFLGVAGLVLLAFGLFGFLYDLRFDPWTAVHAVAGGGLALAGAVGTWAGRRATQAHRRRTKARFGAFAANAIFFAALAALYLVTARLDLQWDFTENRIHTVSGETLGWLDRFDEDVRLTYFAQTGDRALESTARLLDRYADAAAHVRWRRVDPEREPLVAREYEIDRKGVLVLEAGGRRERSAPDPAHGHTEASINATLARLARERAPRVLWIDGHGESQVDDLQDPRGAGAWAEQLQADGVDVVPWLLAAESEIPAETDAVWIVGPLRRWAPEEVERLRVYLDAGGRAAILLEPQVESGLEPLMARYGISPEDDLVLSRERSVWGDRIGAQPILERFPDHPAQAGFRERIVVPTARSLTIGEAQETGTDVRAVALSDPDAWGETDMALLVEGTARRDGEDRPGPLNVAAAARKVLAEADGARLDTRLWVVGDADFLGNAWLDRFGHRDWARRWSRWLLGEATPSSEPPRDYRPSTLDLDATQERTLWRLSVFVLPESLLLIGLAVAWWRRSL